MTTAGHSRRTLLRRCFSVALVLPIATALDACGSSSAGPAAEGPVLTHDEYQDAIRKIVLGKAQTRASELFSPLVDAGTDSETCKRDIRQFYEDVRDAVEQVGALRPPPEAAAIQAEFLEAARDSVRLIGGVADDVEAGKLSCGDGVHDGIYGLPSTLRAEEAISKLEKLDYVVFGQ